MEIVYDDKRLSEYMKKAVDITGQVIELYNKKKK